MGAIGKVLQSKRDAERPAPTLQKVVTIRMPAIMHKSLHEVAHGQCVSLNTLCVAALQATLDELTPPEPQPAT